MATQTQWRGGSSEEHNDFVGANREITIDTDKKTAVIHDGNTEGGFPLAREDLSNVEKQTLVEKLALGNLKEVDINALIAHEKEKLKAEFSKKLNHVIKSSQSWVEHIKPTISDYIKEQHQALLQAAMPIGTVFSHVSNNAPEGFLLLNGETLGTEGSSATHHDEIYKPLYLFLWNNLDEAQLEMSESKGKTALSDWQSNKTMTLPDLRGRSVIGAGVGSGLSNRVLGSIGGAETHTLTTAEMPSHAHSLPSSVPGGNGSDIMYFGYDDHAGDPHCFSSTNSAGGNTAHNNMPPWLALSWIVKY